MNWTVRIAPDTLRRIQLWNQRYPGLAALIFDRFENQLAIDPDACLGPMIVPTTRRAYHLMFPGAPGIPPELVVVFAVLVDRAAHTLDVDAVRMATRP